MSVVQKGILVEDSALRILPEFPFGLSNKNR